MAQQVRRTKNISRKLRKKQSGEALPLKLFKDGSSDTSVEENLNEFLKTNSKQLHRWEFLDSIRKLRDRKLYSHALKLSEVMEERGMSKTISDQGIHLDLLSNTRGINAAESYFTSLPEDSKNYLSSGPLLNLYCRESMTEKAHTLFQKLKELNMPLTVVSYNSILTLYVKTGHPKRVPQIIQEMKSRNILLDSYTYNIWIRALAALDDISGVERVVMEMKREGRVDKNWKMYSNLASIYIDAGLYDKAGQALKELETNSSYGDFYAFQFLITLYGRIGNLHEVYRVWNSLRLVFTKINNVSYLNIIQVLVNLKDIIGAEKLFTEWESGCSTYDIRIANALIRAYTEVGLIEKAEELKERACSRGGKANAKTWEILLFYYLRSGNMKLAVKSLTNAISTPRGDGGKWAPSPEIVRIIMNHFEEEKDVDGAEGFLENLKKSTDNVHAEVFESLLRIYAAAARKIPSMRQCLKMENVKVSEAGKKLLEVIRVD